MKVRQGEGQLGRRRVRQIFLSSNERLSETLKTSFYRNIVYCNKIVTKATTVFTQFLKTYTNKSVPAITNLYKDALHNMKHGHLTGQGLGRTHLVLHDHTNRTVSTDQNFVYISYLPYAVCGFHSSDAPSCLPITQPSVLRQLKHFSSALLTKQPSTVFRHAGQLPRTDSAYLSGT